MLPPVSNRKSSWSPFSSPRVVAQHFRNKAEMMLQHVPDIFNFHSGHSQQQALRYEADAKNLRRSLLNRLTGQCDTHRFHSGFQRRSDQ